MSSAVLFMPETPTRPGSISQQATTRAKSGFLANMSHEIRTEAVTSPDVDGLLEGLRKVLDMLFLRSVTKDLSISAVDPADQSRPDQSDKEEECGRKPLYGRIT